MFAVSIDEMIRQREEKIHAELDQRFAAHMKMFESKMMALVAEQHSVPQGCQLDVMVSPTP
jgi:hypothetical protein